MMKTRLDVVLLNQKRNRLVDIGFAALVVVGVALGAFGFADRARAASPATATAPTAAEPIRSAAHQTLQELAHRERMGS